MTTNEAENKAANTETRADDGEGQQQKVVKDEAVTEAETGPETGTVGAPAAPTTAAAATTDTTTAAAAPVQVQVEDGDDESDLDELDDVLDAFSAANPPATTTTTITQPPQPIASSTTTTTTTISQPQQSQPQPSSDDAEIDEEAFIKQLEAGMAELMGAATTTNNPSADSPADAAATSSAWETLAEQMAHNPTDTNALMKLLMGEDAPTTTTTTPHTAAAADAAAAEDEGQEADTPSFQDTIHKTMQRMQDSGDKASTAAAAAADDDPTDALLAQLLKAMEADPSLGGDSAADGGDGSGGGDLDKIFMGIMEQLSNKEMLYDPMKELDGKFGPWLDKNRATLADEERERFEMQAGIVRDIVGKFEEEGYEDEKPECRQVVWELMQK
ncbi:hypothetical protein AJ80_04296, partial [Polytolypa hystricis UAMH7299]